MAHTGRESPSCNRKKQSKEAQEAGESCADWWSGRRAANMPEIGERGEEKRENTREEERGERNCTARSPWHMPGRNEMQKEPGGARAPEFSSTVRGLSLANVGVGVVSVASSTPWPCDTPHPTGHGHGPRCTRSRACASKKAWWTKDTAAPQSVILLEVVGLPWRNGDGSLGGKKNSGSRAGCDLENVRVPLGSGPRSQIGWLRLLTIPFFVTVNLSRGKEDGHLFNSLEEQKISNVFPRRPARVAFARPVRKEAVTLRRPLPHIGRGKGFPAIPHVLLQAIP